MKPPKRRRSEKSGLSPGTLLHVGTKPSAPVRIQVYDYAPQKCEEREFTVIEECFPYLDTPAVTWVNIDGIHDTKLIESIGTKIGLHPLVLEDIVNTEQRPKLEDHEHHLFAVMKMLSYDTKAREVVVEQLSIVLGPTYVITFQEAPGDAFESVRARIRNAKGRHRKLGADYLFYSLLDAVVDEYFLGLESLGDVIEDLEMKLLARPNRELPQTIYRLKRELMNFRKAIWPTREILSAAERTESRLIHKSTKIYLRDVYDHAIQAIETLEVCRELASGLMEMYLSSVSNRMNEVMKVLTLIATLFMPLTFIAGIYGMNFEHMPELGWSWSYPIGFWALIATIAGMMLWFFWRKKWY